jgi:hypothetical protein
MLIKEKIVIGCVSVKIFSPHPVAVSPAVFAIAKHLVMFHICSIAIAKHLVICFTCSFHRFAE